MRRHDLDWLRVLVFGLLIFYHVGMFFVPWKFHLKNNIIYDWLVYPMWFLNQWRLPILFVISGMGTYYALQNKTGTQFTLERIKRLGLPLIFGMICIISPQIYFERLDKNEFNGNYFDFWPSQLFNGIYPEGNFSWHHLWFLPYLLVFSIILTPLFLYLKNHPNNKFISWIKRITIKPAGLYFFIIPLYLIEAFIEPFFPVTHNLINDWFTFINYITLFFFGFLLISIQNTFWNTTVKYRNYFLITGILSFSIMLFITHQYKDSIIRHFIEAFLKVMNLWSWILALFGFSAKHLNRKSTILNYANEAVYPFYILHQTIMIVIAYYLIELDWSLALKSSIMIIGTFVISWFFYEFLIRRRKYIRPLFGLKKRERRTNLKKDEALTDNTKLKRSQQYEETENKRKDQMTTDFK
ncbi:Peptidoglycan/LPS O-acetylase OafA/YrhL, contains acyltransferase and SGNH-hydrolase domains [Tenacibaculum sp. MAR_2009_124]|uniref:acyltransferase family protein n=1 Tax=Tenacibaculum sp. MAR_2009_124 TaxID=1250059 RepID=UPI000897896F|nr:acyltransferase [Tenacibaculum sp. MAR_2009_124]SED22572.1 Peptidoglycan/LPS O-acetylase OafA/YrhL, contains acyltransferase and SGNH-hydrolase domains [Tenacibaculum sp. MAR_2009_124]